MDVLKRTIAALLIPFALAFPTVPVQATCSGTWEVVDDGAFSVWLQDIAVADPSHAWSVGYRLDADQNEKQRLLAWNGSAWVNQTPPIPDYTSMLMTVWAVAADDVWVAGRYQHETTYESALLAFHWDGVTWSGVPMPAAEAPRGSALWASGPNDVWLAGTEYLGTRYGGMILHYDGAAWNRVDVPNPAGQERWLWGIHGSAADDVWAVGSTHDLATHSTRPVALHWDGVDWSRVRSDRLGSTESTSFKDVFALDADHAWAVGHKRNGSRFLMQEWNGTHWRNAPLADVEGYGSLEGVSAASSAEIYVVGQAASDPIVLRGNGSSWSPEPLPTGGLSLDSIATIGDSSWAVGRTDAHRSFAVTHCA